VVKVCVPEVIVTDEVSVNMVVLLLSVTLTEATAPTMNTVVVVAMEVERLCVTDSTATLVAEIVGPNIDITEDRRVDVDDVPEGRNWVSVTITQTSALAFEIVVWAEITLVDVVVGDVLGTELMIEDSCD